MNQNSVTDQWSNGVGADQRSDCEITRLKWTAAVCNYFNHVSGSREQIPAENDAVKIQTELLSKRILSWDTEQDNLIR